MTFFIGLNYTYIVIAHTSFHTFFLQNILAIKNQTFHTVDAVSYNLHYAFKNEYFQM